MVYSTGLFQLSLTFILTHFYYQHIALWPWLLPVCCHRVFWTTVSCISPLPLLTPCILLDFLAWVYSVELYARTSFIINQWEQNIFTVYRRVITKHVSFPDSLTLTISAAPLLQCSWFISAKRDGVGASIGAGFSLFVSLFTVYSCGFMR